MHRIRIAGRMAAALGLLGASLATLAAAKPTPAEVASRFEKGPEGWCVVLVPDPAPVGEQYSTLAAPTVTPTGGNPDGYLSVYDANDGFLSYWDAPPTFTGDRSAYYGGSLCFDMVCEGPGGFFDLPDVVLVGDGVTLVYRMPVNPAVVWRTFRVPLAEAGWFHDNLEGKKPATARDMQRALKSLTILRIRADYRRGEEVNRLDNVVMSAK